MGFEQTAVSDVGTIISRKGDSNVQWSREVKETSPGVYPQLIEGQAVQLDITTGEIIAVGGADEVTLGFVIVPNSTLNGQRATIQTQGVAIIRCGSTAVIGFSQYVSSVGINTNLTPNRPNATAGSTGLYAQGIALTEATAANQEIEVLLLASSILIP